MISSEKTFVDNDNKYLFCYLEMKDGTYKKYYIHYLVASTFVPNPKNFKYVKHLDGNIWNNNAKNLKWVKNPPTYKKVITKDIYHLLD